MKVYEIISEANPLQYLGRGAEYLGKGIEAAKNPLKGIRGAVGALKDTVAKEIGDIARTKNIKIDQAAEIYSSNLERSLNREVLSLQRDYKEAGKTIPKDSDLRAMAMKNLHIEPEQLDKAFVKDAATKAQFGKAAEALGIADVSAWRLAGITIKAGLDAYGIYVGFYQPWDQFSKTMSKYADMVQKGQLKEEEYNFLLNQELTKLIAAWGTQFVAGSLFKGVANALTPGEKKMGYLLSKTNPKFDLLTDAGLQVFRTWLNNGDNSGAVASLLLTDIMGTEQPLAQFIGKLLAPALGVIKTYTGIAATGAQAAAGPRATTGSSGKPAVGGNSQIDSTSPNVSDAGSAPAVGGGTLSRSYFANDPDMSNWVQDPSNPNRIIDPNNKANSVFKPPGWKPAK
jgi:hypothetical protein